MRLLNTEWQNNKKLKNIVKMGNHFLNLEEIKGSGFPAVPFTVFPAGGCKFLRGVRALRAEGGAVRGACGGACGGAGGGACGAGGMVIYGRVGF